MEKKITIMHTQKPDGTWLKPVIRNTEKGQSAYANRMWNKYGDEVTVEQGYFDDNFNWVLETTWHA